MSLPKPPRGGIGIDALAFLTTLIFLFVNLREKGVSHEAHRDALWMITPNWSVKVHYACLDLVTGS